MSHVAVIGAGWAGCAAAIELAAAGDRVTLFESSRTLGGRARGVELQEQVLDNGQHILLGAYRETLRVMRLAGIDPERALLRLPLQMRYPAGSGMDFVAPRLPAPWHLLAALLRASGLQWQDKMALARFSTTARWMTWRLDVDCSVAELLERFDQTPRLTQLMWRPLCIAALNTPPERASAKVFLNVLRDSLGASREASDMLIPRVDLSALLPQQAAQFIEQRGGSVRAGTTVHTVSADGPAWLLDGERFDAVIVATQAEQAARLLQARVKLPAFAHEPITTVYLQYAAGTRLSLPFFALVDDTERGHWGQFVFDRGQLSAAQDGLMAVVVSLSQQAVAMGHDALTADVAAQLTQVLQLGTPLWSRVITEKRATFSCTPGLQRPATDTGLPGLALAGDYIAGDYPATLEGAVQSGVAAAAFIRARASG